MNLSLKELITAVQGELAGDMNNCLFKGISIDSRSIKRGELFLALKGNNFDGHEYVTEALRKGASGVILERIPEAVKSHGIHGKTLICVDDTIKALGDLASFWRKKHNVMVIAIGGSCGKTTTKEMLGAILSVSNVVLKTEGNLNNHIGLPLTLLKMRKDHDMGVFEVGISRRGEMGRLGEIVSPDMALITNIGEAHLADLKNMEMVAREKIELFRSLKDGGTLVINRDDPLIPVMVKGLEGERISYGTSAGSDVVLESAVSKKSVGSQGGPGEGLEFTVSIRGKKCKGALRVIGTPNLMNVLAAIASSVALHIDWEEIREGLLHFVPMKGRMQMIPLRNGITIIDDTYNANPSSMEHSLKTLSQVNGAGKRLAVLGDMLDLGEATVKAHRDVGKLASRLGLDHLFSVGKYGEEIARGALQGGMEKDKMTVVEEKQDVLPEIMEVIEKEDWILVKGSRGMEMEAIVENLKDYFNRTECQSYS